MQMNSTERYSSFVQTQQVLSLELYFLLTVVSVHSVVFEEDADSSRKEELS